MQKIARKLKPFPFQLKDKKVKGRENNLRNYKNYQQVWTRNPIFWKERDAESDLTGNAARSRALAPRKWPPRASQEKRVRCERRAEPLSIWVTLVEGKERRWISDAWRRRNRESDHSATRAKDDAQLHFFCLSSGTETQRDNRYFSSGPDMLLAKARLFHHKSWERSTPFCHESGYIFLCWWIKQTFGETRSKIVWRNDFTSAKSSWNLISLLTNIGHHKFLTNLMSLIFSSRININVVS